jgi:hypothetical protein
MAEYIPLLKEFGPWSLILVFIIYFLMKSRITIQFSRDNENEQSGDLRKGTQ